MINGIAAATIYGIKTEERMTKNINEFIKELTDYINTNIVGTDNTHITKCVPLDNVTNRGHAILIQVEVPENINEEFQNFGPVYYAEELMREYSQFPIAIIGELINVDVDDFYYELIDMLSNQIKTADMTLDDYEKEDIIITALPAEQVSKQNKEAFVTKELLGLTLTMKGRICNSISNDGQSYFMPISTKDGRVSALQRHSAGFTEYRMLWGTHCATCLVFRMMNLSVIWMSS